MKGPKLTVDEQIMDMQKKGITFDKASISIWILRISRNFQQ